MLANIILLMFMAAMAPAVFAADRASTEPVGSIRSSAPTSLPVLRRGGDTAQARAGGRVTFVGAIVVGTAATAASATGTSATGLPRAGWYGAPSRRVAVRPLLHSELSPQIERLEFPGERIGPMPEAVVTYQ